MIYPTYTNTTMDSPNIMLTHCQWKNLNDNTIIQGFSIADRYIYVGTKIMYNGVDIIGAYINPILPVSNIKVRDAKYTSYQTMSSYLRYMYLKWLAGEETPIYLQVDFNRIYLFGCEVRVFMDQGVTFIEKKQILQHIIGEWNKARINLVDQDAYSQLMLDYAYFVDSVVVDINAYELIEKLPPEMARELTLSKYVLCFNIFKEKGVDSDIVYQLVCRNFDLSRFVPKQYINSAHEILKNIISDMDLSKIRIAEGNKPMYIMRYYCPLDVKPYMLYRSFYAHYPDYNYPIKRIPEIAENVYVELEKIAQRLQSKFALYNQILKVSKGIHTIQAALSLPNEIDISQDSAFNPLQGLCENGKVSQITISDLNSIINRTSPNEQINPYAVSDANIYSSAISHHTAQQLQKLGYIICPGLTIDESDNIHYYEAVVYSANLSNNEYKDSLIYQSLSNSSSDVLMQLERFGTFAALAAILTGKDYNETKRREVKRFLTLFGASSFDAEYFSYYFQCRCNTYRPGFYVPLQRRAQMYLKTFVPFEDLRNFFSELSETNAKKQKVLTKILSTM
jgi:hypothetical protein